LQLASIVAAREVHRLKPNRPVDQHLINDLSQRWLSNLSQPLFGTKPSFEK